ncbi:hypothetical protein BFP72_14615 [Reichenbachiella sp. 5M10]|uniref:GNAT family N-acetyltransferase n=1 Tax=Reichenbachiella sp. 5M10 TaxID=1889772 RepID=UPI000C14EF9D|nr:GNAT family N-acetyltransferase [Reichenbachiella sp. 5M10]PIB36544.1 hypothetical protein BFP72_14615 [Reichenbachiella sp. 5M10]
MLFNEEKYCTANEIAPRILFDWQSKRGTSQSRLILHTHAGQATSLPRSPYAGFRTTGSLTPTDADEMIDALLNFLTSHQIQHLEIKQAPAFIHPTHSKVLHEALSLHGFSHRSDINHHIDLMAFTPSSFHKMEQRKVKKCLKAGFAFAKEDISQASHIHSFICRCRQQQKLDINIPAPRFLHLIEQLPTCFDLYTVRDSQATLLAATVTVQVSPQVVYNFLPAFDRTYGAFSPLALLHHQLIHDLQHNHVSTLDLGISSLDGKPQSNLAKFKERIGGIPGFRNTYTRHM